MRDIARVGKKVAAPKVALKILKFRARKVPKNGGPPFGKNSQIIPYFCFNGSLITSDHHLHPLLINFQCIFYVREQAVAGGSRQEVIPGFSLH